MGVGEILDAAINLCRLRWRALAGIGAFVLVPWSLLQQGVVGIVGGATLVPSASHSVPPAIPSGAAILHTLSRTIFAIGGLSLIHFLVISPFVVGAFARATADIYLGGEPTVRGTYRFAVSRLPSIMLVIVLVALIEGVSVAVLLGPGGFFPPILLVTVPALVVLSLLILVRLQFGTTLVVVEGTRGRRALRRSWNLTRRRFWKILGTILVGGILSSAVGATVGIPFTILASLLGGGWFTEGVGTAISAVLTTPFVSMLPVLLYFDARIRTEGFDLAVMAQELAGARHDEV